MSPLFLFRLIRTIPSLATFMSSLTVITIAVDRFRFIVSPHKSQVSERRLRSADCFTGSQLLHFASLDSAPRSNPHSPSCLPGLVSSFIPGFHQDSSTFNGCRFGEYVKSS